MTIVTKHFCDQCGDEVDKDDPHDCPQDPANVAKKQEEFREWEAEYNRNKEAWEAWGSETLLKSCVPSVDSYPEETAVEGYCVLCVDQEDGSGYYPTSAVLFNPTWGQVALEFDRAIGYTRDFHHCFLEGLHALEKPEDISKYGSFGADVKFFEFATGS